MSPGKLLPPPNLSVLPPPSRGRAGEGGKRPRTKRARRLRRTAPLTERILWQRLRRKTLAGLIFRRQQPIGPYFADFYCSSARLIVELDGPFHDGPEAARQDELRSRWLCAQGYQVLRFKNEVVCVQIEHVLQIILETVVGGRPHSPALPLKGGGRSRGEGGASLGCVGSGGGLDESAP